MNNKPTIIDGVDVAGCEFCSDFDKTCRELNGKYNTDVCDFDKCENINNCYYKQLQRIKERMDSFEELAGELQERNHYLTQRNEQLTEDLTALQQTYEACEKEYKALSIKYSSAVSFKKKKIQKTTPNDVGKKAP